MRTRVSSRPPPGTQPLPWPAVFLVACLAATLSAPVAGDEGEARLAGSGERCLVCQQPVGAGDAAIMHRGRRVALHAGACMAEWNKNSESLFASLQPRSALFQETSEPSPPLAGGWFLLGLYIMLGLVAGAVCGYVAVARGLAAIPWFFAGLVLNVVALAALLARPRADTSGLPAGIPPGLAKVPTTRTPVPCPKCGAGNHPAATHCSGCGATLQPSAESDLQHLQT